ncbi:MAG: ATP-binding protein [Atopobiaceae bacterium]|nr:ATP-binding protein [Atopobiaceae bacterium]MCH4181228.1 ATP-binding protein [Atopobiaceae bacterium]MCH4214640.1 ATP-binding protein [Atopobiaceae bacterium]MCH4230153.1 ATP-binding protein [Atopobiaceae bacterium]MCH4275765.1 ATP-binding protein [Atopobiaceae bacterium]
MRTPRTLAMVVLAFLAACLSLVCGPATCAQAAEATSSTDMPRVLYLSSYAYEWESVPTKLDAARETLGDDALINYVFMDTKRRTYDEAVGETYANVKDREDEAGPYDYVMAADDDALTFVLQYRDELFADVPVVFEGINDMHLANEAATDPLITGIRETFPLVDTIKLATSLYPDATHVLGITDESVSGIGSTEQFDAASNSFPGLTFETLDCSTMTQDQIAAELESRGKETIPVLLMMTTDADGNHFTSTEAVRFLSSHVSVPIFKGDELGIGEGILGGMVVSYSTMSTQASQIVLDLINGTDISTIPVRDATVSCILDKDVMDAYGISKTQVEAVEGTSVTYVNDEPSILDRYGTVLIPMGIVILVLAASLVIAHLSALRRKHYMAEIDERDLMLNSLLDNLPGGVVVYRSDAHGITPTYYSEGMVKLTGLTKESYAETIAEEGEGTSDTSKDLAFLTERLRDSAMRDESLNLRWRLRRKDGITVWSLLSAVFMRMEGDATVYYAVFVDISASVLAHDRELEAQRSDAANEAKTQFLSTVSHDMRTPLNGMLGLCELMLERDVDEATRQDLVQLDSAGHYLLDLINDTLDMSKIESGRLELHPNVCSGKEVLEGALKLLAPSITKKALRVAVHTEGVPWDTLYVDSSRIQQLIVNIVGNAIKFTPAGGSIDLTVDHLSSADGVLHDRFTVTDTGIGMSEEFLPHLFDPFAQESQGGNTSNNGTGLGMPISKQIVTLMGGTISATSRLGHGTCVTATLDLPLATPEQIAAKEKERGGTDGTGPSLAGRRILVVEDNALNAKIAKKLLENQGAAVELAANGQLGLDAFTTSEPGHFDAILMDYRMPIMDGLEATRRIRSSDHAQAATIPIVAMTADAFGQEDDVTKEAGFDAFLTKPIDIRELVSTINELVEGTGSRPRQP